jgi:DHA2 family multidrug resistance protein
VATAELFGISAVALFLAAFTIWLAPRPPKNVKPASGH